MPVATLHSAPSVGKSNKQTPRVLALDALRGLAMVGMILSGAIPHLDTLPGWMFHAQVGPPSFKYIPEVVGITWVDLVFPFFLFTMGAAFPFALSSRISRGERIPTLFWQTTKRAALLVFFAIFLQHLKPWTLSSNPDASVWGLSLVAFGIMVMVFTKFKKLQTRNARIVQVSGFLLAGIALWVVQAFYGVKFSPNRSDIIILVLANMAFFGALIWLLTRQHMLLRLGIMGLLLAMRLAHTESDSWNLWLWNLTPAGWLYTFYFCQYLFIVIPGTIVGDLIIKWIKQGEHEEALSVNEYNRLYGTVAILLTALLVNLIGLYGRYLTTTLVVDLLLCSGLFWLLKSMKSDFGKHCFDLAQWGIYWLLLGISFEAYEGGIHKDSPTLSYYFVTVGLAIFTYLFFSITLDFMKWSSALKWLVMTGQNPMVGYVGASFVVLPILSLLHLIQPLDAMQDIHPWLGVMRGLVITGLDIWIAIWFTKKQLFWKT
ncbi:DUF5009 domain-containing protein [Limibacter armeniacum]|uniref:DUF5009 domain-containing protein n=1 Tax=Limibacter armeniacum TaxID=466084 RepID=UPI002FE60B99